MKKHDGKENSVAIEIGHDELVIRQRYEALSIGNDVLIALWFLVGSVLFFWEATTVAATWCFLLGSLEFLARPVIRMKRLTSIRRLGGSGLDSSGDY